MKNRYFLSAAISLSIIASPMALIASATQAVAETKAFTAQSKGQALVDRAIAASGGHEVLKSLRDGTITFESRAARVGQGTTPDADATLGNPSRTIASRSGGRLAIDRYNGETLGSRYVRGDGPDWIWFTGPNSVAYVDAILAAGIIGQVNTSAHQLLELADRSEYLRAVGRERINGKRYDVATYSDQLGRLQTLYFDTSTGHLAKMEVLGAHPQWGDVATDFSFEDYRDAGDGSISYKTVVRQAGVVRAETSIVDISSDAVDEAIYTQPEDATRNDPFKAPSGAARDLTVETLADDIYFIANAAQGYNVIFVNDDDGVLVLETPQSTQASRDIIRTIGAKFPTKKIKFAVPTHHHFDHSGGIYGFLSAGVPILTTSGNADFAKNIGTARRSIGQNSGPAKNPVVETFEDRRTVGSGHRQVELINVGPNPHADEIVVAYIPAIKSLFMADVFSARGETLPPANANQLAFADKLETLNLDIETFIPVHGRNATADEFWDSVKRGREAAATAE